MQLRYQENRALAMAKKFCRLTVTLQQVFRQILFAFVAAQWHHEMHRSHAPILTPSGSTIANVRGRESLITCVGQGWILAVELPRVHNPCRLNGAIEKLHLSTHHHITPTPSSQPQACQPHHANCIHREIDEGTHLRHER